MRTGRRETPDTIDQDDPYWIGYYDAADPGTVTRPYYPSNHWTHDDVLRWYAGVMAYHRSHRP